jgi:hypothetical protein
MQNDEYIRGLTMKGGHDHNNINSGQNGGGANALSRVVGNQPLSTYEKKVTTNTVQVPRGGGVKLQE